MDEDIEEIKESIVELLLNGDEWRRRDIVETLQEDDDTISESAINHALRELLREGRIERVCQGVYRISNRHNKFQIFGYEDIELIKESIVELLLNGDEWRERDIVETLQEYYDGLSKSAIARALGELLKEGRIEKTFYGAYSIPNIFNKFQIFRCEEDEK